MAERQRLLGWRVSLTNGRAPGHPLTAVGVVRLYRGPWSVERLFQRMRGRPMGMTPLYVRRDDHRKGLLRLFSLVARALTALAYQVRRGLAQSGRALAGLYEGTPKRQTQRPTAERLLRAFKGLHLVIGRWGEQVLSHVSVSPSRRRRNQSFTCWTSTRTSIRTLDANVSNSSEKSAKNARNDTPL